MISPVGKVNSKNQKLASSGINTNKPTTQKGGASIAIKTDSTKQSKGLLSPSIGKIPTKTQSEPSIITQKPNYHFNSDGLNAIANMFKPEKRKNNLSKHSIKLNKNTSSSIGIKKVSINPELKTDINSNLNYISTAMDIVGNYGDSESFKTVLHTWSGRLGTLGNVIDSMEIASNVINENYMDAAKNTRDWVTNLAGAAVGARLGITAGIGTPIVVPFFTFIGGTYGSKIYGNDNDEIKWMINEKTGLPTDVILPLDHPINTEYLNKLESRITHSKDNQTLDSSIKQVNKLIESMSNFSSEKSGESVIKSDKDTDLHPFLTLPSN